MEKQAKSALPSSIAFGLPGWTNRNIPGWDCLENIYVPNANTDIW